MTKLNCCVALKGNAVTDFRPKNYKPEAQTSEYLEATGHALVLKRIAP